ncbi:hypothetical protein AAVH_19644 [Aphelenchoides avenae]|nr:hypothetical protein AAVH_19644 [Aphelenchus avenae]
MSCNNCADAQKTKKAVDALRAENTRLLGLYEEMLHNRERDKVEMERLDRLVKLHHQNDGTPKKRNK